jgi:hypothetical protein
MEEQRMNAASDNNLDWHAARASQEIIKNTKKQKIKKNGKEESVPATSLDNLTTKTLGILQENGVYAAFLYLYSRSSEGEQPIAKQIRMQLLRLTSLFGLQPPVEAEANKQVPGDAIAALEFLTKKICDDLDRLLLVKQLWEQTLIYTRYGAKAWGVEDKIAEDAKKAREQAEKERSEV